MIGCSRNMNWIMELKNELWVFFISMVPLIELRGAVPVGTALGMNWIRVMIIAIAGNLVPVPFIITFGEKVFAWLRGTKWLSGIFSKYEARLMEKSEEVTKYSLMGLCLFVAVPLPGTGAWSGAAIAVLLNMRMRYAFCSIALGVLIAAVIMTLVSSGVFGAIRFFG